MTGAPGLRKGVRIVYDEVRGTHAALYPEGALLLSATAASIVLACDGQRDPAGIAASLAQTYEGVAIADVVALLGDLATRRLVTHDGSGRPATVQTCTAGSVPTARPPVPVGLLAELTYRCPLRCTYCSNPVELSAYRQELDADAWHRVLDEARDLGVLQVHFSGGEPLLRPELEALVGHARRLGMYTNLITSGIPLSAARLAGLVDAGLDHLQLSIQDATAAPADAVAGIHAHERKLAVADLVRRAGLPLTVNVVLHAGNVDRLTMIAELAAGLGADRLELAHTQFYGWGLRNRATLMPTREQVRAATEAVGDVHRRFGAELDIVYVEPDYYNGQPKPCMNGWGNRQIVVAPNGDVLPCLAAGQLPDLDIKNVEAFGLAAIWYDSAAFNRFRGDAWMRAPCRECALREVDFGGCRCQAFQLTGDAAATDPACRLSPEHALVGRIVQAADRTARPAPVPRRFR